MKTLCCVALAVLIVLPLCVAESPPRTLTMEIISSENRPYFPDGSAATFVEGRYQRPNGVVVIATLLCPTSDRKHCGQLPIGDTVRFTILDNPQGKEKAGLLVPDTHPDYRYVMSGTRKE